MTLFGFSDPLDLLTLQRELEHFFRRPNTFDFAAASGVFPAINAFSDREGIVVRAEVPGVKPESVQVDIEGRRLTVSGERTPPDTTSSFHRRERRFGKFSRTVQLPNDLDADKASATVKDGLLTIRIPKREEVKPRQVTVKAA
jgi:HSP20 family protein